MFVREKCIQEFPVKGIKTALQLKKLGRGSGSFYSIVHGITRTGLGLAICQLLFRAQGMQGVLCCCHNTNFLWKRGGREVKEDRWC